MKKIKAVMWPCARTAGPIFNAEKGVLPSTAPYPPREFMYYDPEENDAISQSTHAESEAPVVYYNFPKQHVYRSTNEESMRDMFATRLTLRDPRPDIVDPETRRVLKPKTAAGIKLENGDLTYLLPYHPPPAPEAGGSLWENFRIDDAGGDALLQLFNHLLALLDSQGGWQVAPRYSQFRNVISYYPNVVFYLWREDTPGRFEMNMAYEARDTRIKIAVIYQFVERSFVIPWTAIDEALRSPLVLDRIAALTNEHLAPAE